MMWNGSAAVATSKRSVPGDRAPLRKLHSQIQAAELCGDTDTLLELLERAPVQYRAAHALVSFLPRMLLEDSPTDDDFDMRPGDAPSDELDAIEAEELEDSTSEDDANEIELLEAAPLDAPASASDTEHLSDASVDRAPMLEEDAPTLRTLGRLRRLLIMTMRAESKCVTQLSNADGRAAKQESLAREAGSLVLEVAPAARAAAAQAEDAYSTARGARPDQAAADGACASVLAARAADRFRELAEAELNAAAARKRAVDARERATALRDDAFAKIRDTHRQLVRAAGVYNAFLLQVGRTRAGHRETGSAAARDAGQDADGDSDEPHGADALDLALNLTQQDEFVAPTLNTVQSEHEGTEYEPVIRDVGAFMADPTVEGVAQLTRADLLAIATDWLLRDRVQTWLVCDRRHPIPPYVRARELVILEARWRVRRELLPDDFLHKMSVFSLAARRAAESRARDEAILAALSAGREPRAIVDDLGVTMLSVDRIRELHGYTSRRRARTLQSVESRGQA